jgi:adenosylcobinamide-phosphate synthase
MTTFLLLAGALVVDAIVGEPDVIWRRVPHPIVLIGRGIGALDRQLNRTEASDTKRRALGVATVLLIVLVGAGLGWLLTWGLRSLPFGWIVEILIAAIFLAQRSLHGHVRAVARAFASGGLGGARAAVSRIVGRDPASLDEAGVCRAAIESNAENYSDGVLAPAFWYAAAGLPGLLVYKAINTADSMIGHRTARHAAFGWAAARLDDVLNFIPARLCGLLLAAMAWAADGSFRIALATMMRDADKHRSVNAGWPEAAMAGALGVALAGPRRYGGLVVDDDWMGVGNRTEATPDDINRSLRVTQAAGIVLVAITLVLGLLPPA